MLLLAAEGVVMTGSEIIEAYRNQSERSLEEMIDAELERLERTNERMSDSMHKIKNWTEAYPLQVFPEPDMKRAAEVLKDAGLTLDAISASSMRHVLNGVREIAGAELDL